MRKVLSLIVLVFLSFFYFSGCAQSAPKSDRIVIWHWMTDRDKAFQELAARYKEQTGIEVVFELYAPSDVYSQKIIASAQARKLPDIFGILDKKSILAEFIKSGFVADLTEFYKADDAAWEKSLFPKDRKSVV